MIDEEKFQDFGLADSIINMAANLGTDRDKRSYSRWSGQGGYSGVSNRRGFSGNLTQNRNQLEVMYEKDGLCGKIIDIPVDDMMREWRTVSFAGNDEMKTAFEKAEEHYGVREHITDALKWAALYGGSGIVLGVDGCGNPVLPLNVNYMRKNSLKFITTLDRWYLTPQDINYYDISQPNYFKPNYYRIAGTAQLIHHSRMIRFDGVKMPRAVSQLNWLWGSSKLERLEDALLNAATTPNVLASLILECNFPVFSIKNLAATLSTKDGEAKLQKRMSFVTLLKSMFNVTMLDVEEAYDLKSPSMGGLDVFMDKFFQIVAGLSDIPVTRLMGLSPGGLNSTGNTEVINYYDGLKSKQELLIRPALKILDQGILMSTFGFIPKEFSWEFNKLWQISDLDQATIDQTNSITDTNYVNANILPPTVIAKKLKKNDTYPDISEDLISEVGNNFVTQNTPPKIDLGLDNVGQENNESVGNSESSTKQA